MWLGRLRLNKTCFYDCIEQGVVKRPVSVYGVDMSARYFTLEEANALLPQIEPVMARLLERRGKAARLARDMEPLLADIKVDVGGPILTELTQDFVAIEEMVQEIQSFGCLVKNLNAGLLDFLAVRDGREVYLCWRYGEPEISFYHELHTGFNGRQPV